MHWPSQLVQVDNPNILAPECLINLERELESALRRSDKAPLAEEAHYYALGTADEDYLQFPNQHHEDAIDFDALLNLGAPTEIRFKTKS